MEDGSIVYHAASPDERALVYGAKRYGYVFDTRTPAYVDIDALGKRERFEILNVLEFTSTRKRMSIIARNSKGEIKLYCKGADTVIYERLSPNGQSFSDLTLRHLEDFATEGLRTLCLAVAIIPDDVYNDWKETYHKAVTSMNNRERKVEDAANLIENNLMLLGASAIEDKLQEGEFFRKIITLKLFHFKHKKINGFLSAQINFGTEKSSVPKFLCFNYFAR